jgi:addiction module RelE/StbE family toxin
MYKVEWKDEALEGLSKIGDRVKIDKVRKKVEKELSENPYKQEPLKGNIKHQRALHLLGNKYRIVYEIHQAKVLVVIVEAG